MVELKFVKGSFERLQLTDEEYFGSALPNYVSNSLLKLINPDEGGSPQRFNSGFVKQGSTSSAMELGSAVHGMILEPDKYILNKMDKPTGLVGPIFDTIYNLTHKEKEPLSFDDALQVAVVYHDYYGGKPGDKRTANLLAAGKEYYEYLKEFKTPGTIALTSEMKGRLLKCIDSVNANKAACDLLYPESDDIFEIHSFNEDVIIGDLEVLDTDTGESVVLSLKAKIDNWSLDKTNKIITLNDLKTTGKTVQEFPGSTNTTFIMRDGQLLVDRDNFVEGSFTKFHYHRQMAMYSAMLGHYCAQEFGADETWQVKVNMIVVETNVPFKTQVFNVTKKWMDYGTQEFKSLITRLAWHKINGFDKILEFEGKSEIIDI